ncbi:MAG: hypothetical protein ABSG43_01075 [Solirubrobacteraceae bacterium]|jgi:hypothetical protein
MAPHPVLRPTLAAVVSILAANTSVCALPIGFTALGWHRLPGWRRAIDLLLVLKLGANAWSILFALARWNVRLLPYIPQAPLELGGVAVAVSVWIRARRQPDDVADQAGATAVIRPAAITLALLTAAALIEVFATPHAP